MFGFVSRSRFGLLQYTIWIYMALLLYTGPATTYGFAGGTGQPSAPYQIATKEHLLSINKDKTLLQKHFKLIADIDLDPNLSGGVVFEGSVIQGSFSGTFDGAGHRITNMVINAPLKDKIGLFSSLMYLAKVKYLVLKDVKVTGSNSVGVLCGSNYGMVERCEATGIVSGQDSTGGLVGENYGTVNSCCSSAQVNGRTHIGGLVGYNTGTLDCCYSLGSVVGNKAIGGLVGSNRGVIIYCYSAGGVSGKEQVGGLIGATVEGYSSKVYLSFWDLDVSGLGTSAGGIGKNTGQLQTASTFRGWGYTNAWVLDEGRDYPRLIWQGTPGSPLIEQMPLYAGGDGSPAKPFQIASPQQLVAIGYRQSHWASHFILTDDIDMKGLEDQVFVPIGSYGKGFTGSFDGQGHTISNLSIDLPNTDQVGFFAYVGLGGRIINLNLRSAYVVGRRAVGMLVGNAYGSSSEVGIRSCSVQGKVQGQAQVGGLVGSNGALVDSCSADVEVIGDTDVGGLVGINSGSIKFSLSRGSVAGTSSVGGLVGYNGTARAITSCYSQAVVRAVRDGGGLIGLNYNEAVLFCYAAGFVEGQSSIGGLVGRGSEVHWCFWDTDSTGQSTSTAGMGRSKAQMQKAQTFAGWGLYKEWVMPKTRDYPRLSWEGYEGTVLDPRGSYSGGSGTSDDPYRIATAADLAAIGWHPVDFDKSFVLACDIDASRLDPSMVLPIGVRPIPFTGTFEGNDKQILDYQIVWPGRDYVGLFGLIDNKGKVRGIRLVRPIASGARYVGTIAGHNAGLVEDCSAEQVLVSGTWAVGGFIGNCTALIRNARCSGVVRGGDGVGGLIGCASGPKEDCHCVVDVNGINYVGGLIGMYGWTMWTTGPSKSIERCHSSGTVKGRSSVGGLVGTCRDVSSAHSESPEEMSYQEPFTYTIRSSLIKFSYSDAGVLGDSDVGGLVGHLNLGEIMACYSRGSVAGRTIVGGLVGRMDGGVRNSYFAGSISVLDPGSQRFPGPTGDLTLAARVGAIAGQGPAASGFLGCVWDRDVANVPRGLGSVAVDPNTILGWTTSQMTSRSGYIALGWGSSLPIWTLADGLDYPHLIWEGCPGQVLCDELTGFCRGNGTPDDPYQIFSPMQLVSLSKAREMWDRHFVLTSDIDLDPNLPGGMVFEGPVIGRAYVFPQIPFTGSFDGKGYTIKNLLINAPNLDYVGLFSQVGPDGRVCNIVLANANVIGRRYVGCLAGLNRGIISRCHVNGVTRAVERVGGLVGTNSGLVEYCYVIGAARGDNHVGGLIGNTNFGIVRASYALAEVAGTGTWVGGAVGSGYGARHCYFLDQVDGGGPDNKMGIPLRLGQMYDRASFIGLDFWGTDIDGTEDVWFMPSDSYPILACQGRLTGLEELPQMRGLALEKALDTIRAKGLFIRRIWYDYSQSVPMGAVLGVYPVYTIPGIGIDMVLSAGRYYWTFNEGDGTVARPYLIRTIGQLESLGHNPQLYDRCFVLAQDLDLGGHTHQDALIAADLDPARDGFQGHAFNGTFDGAGHRIRGLRIVTSRPSHIGLFGAIGANGLVKDLKVEEACIICGSRTSYVGILAGSNAGLIRGCAVSGIVLGGTGGPIVGYSPGRLEGNTTDVARY